METKIKHDPRDTIGCSTDNHCFIHNVDEPFGYLTCFECKHTYRSMLRLIWEDFKLSWKIGEKFRIRLPRHIYCCPMCIHDF